MGADAMTMKQLRAILIAYPEMTSFERSFSWA
jgi:hypothetical protein